MNLIKKSGKGYWEDMVISPWSSTFTKEEEQELISSAISVIEFLAKLPFENTTNQNVLHYRGKCLMSAVYFLSKNDGKILLNVIKQILETQTEGRCLLKMDVRHFQFEVAVFDMKYFIMIVVSSVNNISSIVKRDAHELKALLIQIFCEMFKFVDIRCPYSIVITKTMNLLLKNHLTSIELQRMHFPIISLAGFFGAICSFNKAVEHLQKMSQVFMDSWTEDKKHRIFNGLCMNYTWDSFDCYIIYYLMGPNTSEKNILSLHIVMERICSMLHDKNVSKAAVNIFKSLVVHVDEKMWVYQLLPILMKVVSNDDVENSSFIRSVLLECFDIAVKHYGIVLYEDIISIIKDLNYIKRTDFIAAILTLKCCFKRNFLNFPEYETDILCLYYSTYSYTFLQDYILQAACFCHDKNTVVMDLQLNFIINYLQDLMYLPDRDYSFTELWYFMSHICVNANFNINNQVVIDSYIKFIENIYNFCLDNLKSRCPDRISIAHEVYHITETVFTKNWKCLKTRYQLPEREQFQEKQAKFYSFLMENKKWPFANQNTFKCLYQEFHYTSKVYLDIANLIIEWINCYPCEEYCEMNECFDRGMRLFQEEFDYESIMKGCYYILISICYKRNRSENFCEDLSLLMEKWIEEISDFCYDKNMSGHSFPLYGLTMCVNKVLRSGFLNDVVDEGYSKKQLFYHCYSILVNLASFNDPAENFEKYLCLKKCLEHTLTTCLDIIEFVLSNLEDFIHDSKEIIGYALDVLNLITKGSNKKRPVAAAATSLRKLCSNILGNDCQNGSVIKLLDSVLDSIYNIPAVTSSMVRRNPEHRLVIHAIVAASECSSQIFVPNTMNFLLKLLYDSASSNQSIISALNATEILLSDSALRIPMLSFIEPIAIYCINQLSNTDWAVRNATIQVYQSFVNRVLGQKTNSWFRRNSIEDIFMLSPRIAEFFQEKLYNANIEEENNSIVGILAFFSESHRKSTLFMKHTIVDSFLEQFLSFVIFDEGSIGLFAANAFVAVCPHMYIPVIVREIIHWLEDNGHKKNVFGTCMYLIGDLCERFKDFCHVPYYNDGIAVINEALFDLKKILEKLNKTYEFSLFSLLNIKASKLDDIVTTISEKSQINTFEMRLWRFNNVSFLLLNIELHKFCNILTLCFTIDQLVVQENCLSTVLERFEELREAGLVAQVLEVVLIKFINSNVLCKYLSDSFCNVILFLLEIDNYEISVNILNGFFCKFKNISDLQIASLYLALLSKTACLSDHDNIYVVRTVELYKDSAKNPELQYHAAWTLKYLYKCVKKSSDRHDILHLAFVLLLNSDISSEICKFLANVFGIECFSLPLMIDYFLTYSNLATQFESTEETCKFLQKITKSVLSLEDGFTPCAQFYMKQNDNLNFNKIFLKKLLIKTINKTINLEIIDEECEEILLSQMILLVT